MAQLLKHLVLANNIESGFVNQALRLRGEPDEAFQVMGCAKTLEALLWLTLLVDVGGLDASVAKAIGDQLSVSNVKWIDIALGVFESRIQSAARRALDRAVIWL